MNRAYLILPLHLCFPNLVWSDMSLEAKLHWNARQQTTGNW